VRRGDVAGGLLTALLVVVLAVVSLRTLWMQMDDFRARVEALETAAPPQPVEPCPVPTPDPERWWW
jgi:hypothetical protein